MILSIPVYQYSEKQIENRRHLQILEIILEDMYNQKSKSFIPPKSMVISQSFTNIWSFFKSIIELTTRVALIGLDTEEVKEIICLSMNEVHASKIQCTKWLNNCFQNSQTKTNQITKDIFTAIVYSLDCAYDGQMLKVKKSYQISPQLICIFYYFSFSSMNDLIETLQSILQRSSFTFQFLSKKYLKNMSERRRRVQHISVHCHEEKNNKS